MIPLAARADGVCDRTSQVQDAIVLAVGSDSCANVTDDDLKDVTALELQGRSIAALGAGDFDGLIRLQELNLSDNELSELPSSLFDPLFSLRSLYLHDNDLASLPTDLFDRLYLLDELTLHGNQLAELPEGMFDDLSRFNGLLLGRDGRGLERVRQFIQQHEATTPEQFIEALPELHKQRFVFVYDSEGLGSEFVSGTHPRVVSWGADARFAFAWTTDPEASEMFRQSIEFLIPDGNEWAAGVIDFSGTTPVIDRPEICKSCHGALNKPLWGGYATWEGTETTPYAADVDTNDANMRALVESTNDRILPLDFSGADFSNGYHQRFLSTSDEFSPYVMAVEEIGMVLALRHAEVLFQRLKAGGDYSRFAEETVCSSAPVDAAISRFLASSDQSIGVMLSPADDVQNSYGLKHTSYPYYEYLTFSPNGTLAEALVFLMVHDLWNDIAEVRQAYRSVSNSDLPAGHMTSLGYQQKEVYLVYPPGSATAEDELIQLYRMHFGYGNRSSLNAIDSLNPWHVGTVGIHTADFWVAQLDTMIPKVCAALKTRDSRAHNLVASIGVDGAVDLSWDAPRGDISVTGFQILRGSPQGTLDVLVANTGSTATTYSDSSVIPGTAYRYSVVPVRGGQVGEQSIPVTIRTPSSVTATFTMTAAPDSIAEGESATLTVAISNGVTFAEDRAIALAVTGGTAAADDYSLSTAALTLTAGTATATAELEALADQAEEAAETVMVAATLGGVSIGAATVTINSVSHDATLSALSLSGTDIGTFASGTTAYTAAVAHEVSSTTVTATASHAEAEVSIAPGAEVSLAEGANQITVTVTAEDGTTTQAYTVTVTRAGMPEVSIAAVSSAVTEGAAAAFDVRLAEAAFEALTVTVSVTEGGAMLSGTPPASVAFSKGDTSVTLSVPTAGDLLVEADSAVTALVAAGTGYRVGPASAATVTVEDDDAAEFTVSAAPAAIDEGESATLTVAIANGVTFAQDQTVALAVTGTASASDYTVVPAALALAAGASSATADLTASDDQEEEADETLTVEASLGGVPIGAATVTIASVSHDATLSALSLSGIDIGTFSSTVTSYAASVSHGVESTTVTATASHPEAAVLIAAGAAANLAVGANEITVTVTAEDGTTTQAYTLTVTRAAIPVVSIVAVAERVSEADLARFTVSRTGPTAQPLEVKVRFASTTSTRIQLLTVRLSPGQESVTRRVQVGDNTIVEDDVTVTWTLAAGAGYAVSTENASASVVLEENDAPEFAVSVEPAEIAEGETATVRVAITNGVTFRQAETITLSVSGTASATDYSGVPAMLTLDAYTTSPRFSATATLTAAVDEEEEAAETVTITAAHNGSVIGSATVTINSVSHDASLATLSLSGIDIGTFSGATTSYQASVQQSVETTTVTATANHSGASVSIDPGSEVSLAAGANRIRVTVTAESGTRKSYTVTVTRVVVPVVSIAAVEERVLGPIGEFTVSRTGSTAEPLEVQALFATSQSRSVQTLTIRFLPGQRSGPRRVQAGDNKLVEDDITVTWTLQAGEGYTVSAEQASASLVLEESDVPKFAVSVEPAEVAEGESATVTVAIPNGVRFREAQTIDLSVSGTASVPDYTGVPATLTLPAYATTAATATLTAPVDEEEEAEETVTITASHGGSEIGSATVTIAASEAAPPLTAKFVGMPATHDGETAFAFELRFSQEAEISFRTLRDAAFEVTGGSVTKVRRLARPSKLRWEITVQPTSAANVGLALPVTTDCAAEGAACTAGGKGLSQRVSATVKGPAEVEAAGFSLVPENSRPSGIWSDGETAWVADLDDARLYAYRRSDGERQPGKDIATEPAPMGLWADGETLWVAGLGGGLRAHRLADGLRLAARDLTLEANTAPAGIWSEGETAWVADWLGDTVHAYRLSDGRREVGRDIKLAGGNLMPVGLWSDGETLWVADWRERMHAYRLSDGGRDPRLDIEAGAGDTDPTGLWSGGGTLLATGWEGGEVRAYRLPVAVAGAAGKQPGAGLTARAVSLPAIADPALQAAVGAALGKAPGEAVSPQELAGLEALTARNAGIRDLSGLEQALSLEELDLGFNPLADLRPLAGLPALESLSLDGAAEDLHALAPLARLQRLSLRHNGLDDLGPLAGLTSLVELDLGDNAIADLSPLAGLGKLAVLRADRNLIEDLWPLASLAGLEVLELGANRVRDLQPLAGLARLQSLRLGGNGLAELHPLSGLGGLQDLGLAGNAVEDLRALSHLDGLRRLDLRGNPAGDLRPLRALGSLAWVHVGGSRIADLGPLNGLPGLTVAGGDDRDSPSVDDGQNGRARQQ